ncbi:MAG: glycosyltransferase [Desulfosudaceae bacterium]
MNKWDHARALLRETFLKYVRFFIPANSRVLMFGCPDNCFLDKLRPEIGIGVAAGAGPGHAGSNIYYVDDIETFYVEETFDYIIINEVLDSAADVRRFLVGLLRMAGPETRIILNSLNPGWKGLISTLSPGSPAAAGRQTRAGRFSRRDLEKFLAISGYEIITRENYLLLPWPVPVVAAFTNRFLAKLPLLRRCCLGRLTVARPDRPPADPSEITTSVVITCRDEEGNIRDLVERIPVMGKKTELVFVEGHSVDNTVGRVREMMRQYPDRDIKLYHQTGIGQGDAFRLGFDRAEGDFLIWLEADLTTPPEEARHIWEAYAGGHGEYINGSRFVYPMAPGAMPPVNKLGNRFFSRVMSLVTGRDFTDTLCGFKGITRTGYQHIVNSPNRFDDLDPFGDFLLILGAVRYNLKIAEVPVHYQPRKYGESKAYGRSWFGLLTHARLLFKICRQAFIDFRLL